ncbi:MAG TPA: M28 family metallopeptidase [Vicinamibacterales bacterium]|nr:M28 family metallopeptidase [Vicinamibacterales bacterium]
MRLSGRVLVLILPLLVFHPAIGSQDDPSLRGFTAAAARAQRERERQFREIPNAENLRDYMRATSAEPHHAGAPGSRRVAEYILAKFKSWGLDAVIEEHEALMPFPRERSLELVAPQRFSAKLEEPRVEEDEDSGDEGQLPTFNAYSGDGDVTGELVYVNYGIPEDYEHLRTAGIDVKGKIVIARYGRSWRGIKPKVAWEHGAVGCIIYSDPREDGYFQGDVYPEGAYRPEHGVQRGSVMDMPIHPGDPLTPGWNSERGGRKLDRSESRTILKIPVLPISYADALPLLTQLRGPVAPESWRGALPMTYHIGPGPARVRLKLSFDWQQRPLYNVVARITGSEFPDQWIVYGNHHDAWVNGASDPTSGNVVLMETARGLAEMLEKGWRPKRTIVFTSWDGEEWGLLGSTEWAEKHKAELMEKAVAYINTDATGRGWLSAAGSHSLQAFVNELARDIPDPRGKATTVLAAKLEREREQARTEETRRRRPSASTIRLEALGSGSDYTAFIDHLTIASLNLGFSGDDGGGVYHSIYDSFHWYTHFSDKDFTFGATLARLIGTALLRLADADVLPFEFRSTARTLREYVDDLDQGEAKKQLRFAPLRAAIERLEAAASRFEQSASRVRSMRTKDRAALQGLNRVLYQSERAFRHEDGLPGRDWFKHLAYAPGLYTGYGVKTLPAIREGIEQGNWDDARRFLPLVARSVDKLAREVDRAARMLNTIAR